LCKSQSNKNKKLHYSINATGVDISSEEGSVSYSIGQVYYSSHSGEENNVAEGIQQPLIIQPIDKKEEEEEEEESLKLSLFVMRKAQLKKGLIVLF
jgi:hypothetical protein